MNGTGLKLKGGYGYWQTDLYPIGGAFRRAPAEGKDIAEIIRTFKQYKACDTEVRFTDGTRGAVASSAIEGGAQ